MNYSDPLTYLCSSCMDAPMLCSQPWNKPWATQAASGSHAYVIPSVPPPAALWTSTIVCVQESLVNV